MHLLGICVLLVFLLFTNLASDFSRSDDYYYDYYYEQERTEEPVRVSTSITAPVRLGEPATAGIIVGLRSSERRFDKNEIKKTASPRWGGKERVYGAEGTT